MFVRDGSSYYEIAALLLSVNGRKYRYTEDPVKGKWCLRLPPSVKKNRELTYNNQVLASALSMQFPHLPEIVAARGSVAAWNNNNSNSNSGCSMLAR